MRANCLSEGRRGGTRQPRTGAAMSTAPSVPAIQATLTVGVPVERAFRVFTGSFNTWWPAEYHIGSADGPDLTTVELEHRLIDRLVGAQAIHDTLISGGSWIAMLELFAKAAAN